MNIFTTIGSHHEATPYENGYEAYRHGGKRDRPPPYNSVMDRVAWQRGLADAKTASKRMRRKLKKP